MKIKLSAKYEQPNKIISQLPADEVSQSRAKNKEIIIENSPVTQDEWETLLINGPVMSEKQYQDFKKSREKFDQWRKN